MEPNNPFMNPELQLSDMLNQVSQNLPSDKLQKVNEILNSALATEMLLKHSGFYKALESGAKNVSDAVRTVAPKVADGIDSTVETVKQGLGGLADRAGQAIKSFIKPSPQELPPDMADNIRGGLEDANPVDEDISDMVSNFDEGGLALPDLDPASMFSSVAENFVNTAGDLRSGIQNALTQGQQAVEEGSQALRTAGSQALSEGENLAANIGSKVEEGISTASKVINTAESASEVAEAIPGVGTLLEGGLAIAGLATSLASVFEKTPNIIPSYTGFQEGL